MITFNHCNYLPVSFIHSESKSVFSLSLSLKLLLVYAATPAKVASLPVDSLGTVSRVAQMGCETLTDPDPNLTPLKVTGTTCVCISVSVYVRLACFGKAIHYALNHHFDVRKNTEILPWGQSL